MSNDPPNPRAKYVRPGSRKLGEPEAHIGAKPPKPQPIDLGVVAKKLEKGVNAYPGSVTYLDLIRKSKRHSVMLMVAMVLLGGVLGAAIGGFVSSLLPAPQDVRFEMTESGLREIGSGPSGEAPGVVPGLLIGFVSGLGLAVVGAIWAFYQGANAILGMTHARPITKEQDPQLYNVTEEMAIAAGIPMPKLYVVRDTAMNAFATGRDPEHGVVAITTGLRQKLTRDELQGVIAHEIAHIRHYDIRFAMLMATMVGLIVLVSDGFLRTMWYGAAAGGARVKRSKEGGGGAAIVMLVIAILLAILAPIAARIIQMSYSRQREYLADAGAVELTRNPAGIASALVRLSKDRDPLVDTANRGVAHMFIVNPLKKMHSSGQALNSMLASHPPIKERVTRLVALMR